jgi:hypothetical protein
MSPRREPPREPPRPPPPQRFPPGTLAPARKLADAELERRIRAALVPEGAPKRVVWHEADSQVVFHPGRARVRAVDGLVLVGLTLECDQTGVAEVVVPFAVGTEEQPTGLVAASETKPRGPEILIDRWGEAIVAAAWTALLEAAAAVAAEAGSDLDGEPLRPGGLIAFVGGVAVVPQARHEFERAARA